MLHINVSGEIESIISLVKRAKERRETILSISLSKGFYNQVLSQLSLGYYNPGENKLLGYPVTVDNKQREYYSLEIE